ncbi:MAG: hypothetical protein ACI9YR_002117, partial [Bacteroidia bacterium]
MYFASWCVDFLQTSTILIKDTIGAATHRPASRHAHNSRAYTNLTITSESMDTSTLIT